MYKAENSGHKAFTITELMVAILIFTIVIGASYALMTSGRKGWHSGDVRIELQEDLRQAMDTMVYELSEASPDRVTIDATGPSITLQVPVDENATGSWEDTDSDGQADFYLEDTLDNSGNIRWGAYLRQEDRTVDSATLPFGLRVGRSVVFTFTTDELRRRVLNSGGAVIEDFLLSDNVQGLSFTRTSNEVITIIINGSKLTLNRHPINYSLTTAVYLKGNE